MSEHFGKCCVTDCTCGVSNFAVALARANARKDKDERNWSCPDPDCDSHIEALHDDTNDASKAPVNPVICTRKERFLKMWSRLF